jgi:hypothetical protein
MRQFNAREANPDLAEGVAALVEKRLPAFGPLPPGLRLPDPLPLAGQ